MHPQPILFDIPIETSIYKCLITFPYLNMSDWGQKRMHFDFLDSFRFANIDALFVLIRIIIPHCQIFHVVRQQTHAMLIQYCLYCWFDDLLFLLNWPFLAVMLEVSSLAVINDFFPFDVTTVLTNAFFPYHPLAHVDFFSSSSAL